MGLVYTSIRASDLEKSVGFYTKSLGMREVGRRSPIEGEQVVVLESPDTKNKLQLMWYAENCRLYKPYEHGDEMDHIMFEVKDAKKEYGRLISEGAPAATELFERGDITLGFVKDPDGIWIGLKSGGNKPKAK